MKVNVIVAATLCVWVMAGCIPGDQTKTGLSVADPNSVTPPATAGTADALVGTNWELEPGRTLSFGADGKGTASSPMGPPFPMGYTLREDGVITVIVGEAGQAGTWDGTQLILNGKPLKRIQ